ncbi:MAG: hypothetical protein QM532_04370 [Cyanobium sp. MAG06]|nr:hypothetical protein [Cyanobium sp. MAG06]
MNKEYNHTYYKRIFLCIVILIFLLIIFIGRLFYLQIIRYDYYKSKSEEQYINKDINLYRRGNIY